MSKHWILDVLTDLRAYAGANDMPVLAQHLEEAALLAVAELAQTPGVRLSVVQPDGAEIGRLPRQAANGGLA